MKKVQFLIVFYFFSAAVMAQTMDVFDVARKGTVGEAEAIIKINPKAFDVVNAEGNSPLLLACYRGNNAVAKLLIAKGVSINLSTAMGTALMAAVVKGNNEIAKVLIENKADVNAADTNGTTALIYAVQFQNPVILKLLVQNKVDKAHKDKEGKTAFEYAVFSGNEEIINLLK